MPIPGIVASVNRALGEEPGGGEGPCDEYWDDVVLLMHMDTDFTDETGKTTTPLSGAVITSAESKFGDESATGGGVTVPYTTDDFDWWTDDYTVECWVKRIDGTGWEQYSAPTLIGNRSATTNGEYWTFGPINNGKLYFGYWNGSWVGLQSSNPVTDISTEWVHFAMTHTDGTIRIFANGAKLGESTVSGTPQSNDDYPLAIFKGGGITPNGYIDDLRITKGVARYTGDTYTIPEYAFGGECVDAERCDPALANVVFAMHMDDTPASDGEYTFTDTLSALPTQSGSASWNDVAWNGSVFCAVGGANNLAATSPDGITWTLRTMPAVAGWLSIAWNGTVFCAISGGYAATSPDGITWTLSEALWNSHGWYSIFSNGTIFVALSTFGYSAVSTNGVTWAVTANTLFKTTYWSGFAWNGSVFCLADLNSNRALTSPDGITWTTRTLPLKAYWSSVAWNGTVFCAVANGNVAATSPDGITWTRRSLPDYHTWLYVVACEGTFYTFALGTNKVAFSRDGIIWEQRWIDGLSTGTDWGKNVWGDGVLCTLYEDDLCLLTELTFPTATAAVFTEETGQTITGLDGAKITAVDYKFGSGALTGGGLTAAYSSDFDWWDDDFTIELFIRRIGATGWQDSNGVPTLLGNRSASGSTSYWAFGPLNNGKLSFQYWNGALVTLTSASALTGIDTSWLHLMMTQKDGTIYLFSQGTKVAEAAVSGTPQSSSAQPLTLFQGGGLVPNGYVDEVRIVKGVARYIADFTPPTTPFGEFEC